MHSNIRTLSRPSAISTPPQPPALAANPKVIPSIRLISATPSAAGNSSTASTSLNFTVDDSWASAPSPLAPKADSPAPRKRLVPKKSKLSILGVGGREKDKGKDLSDVVRRIGGDSASARGGFEIYVDPTIDDEIGEIVMVKKKKSRLALDGMKWGALGEVTNIPPATAPSKEAPGLLKVKGEEKDKWWTIGRGRKDSKEKTKEGKKHTKSPEPTVKDPYPRSKTPEPLKLSQPADSGRTRFNSLDSGILLNTPITMGPSSNLTDGQTFATSQQSYPAEPSPPITYSRSGTPTAGGLLAPPLINPYSNVSTNNQGSIAVRAMRSVRSLARIGSWAQLRNSDEGAEGVSSVKVKLSKENEKEGKKKKKKKEKKNGVKIDGEEGKKKVKTKKKEKEDDKAQTLRMSTSSFEVGAASPMPKEKVKSLGKKKHSTILGLGLPSTIGTMTMRLPAVRSGSTASSVVVGTTSNRLSAESAHILGPARDRAGSVMSTSTASSLRPMSVTSSLSGGGSRISSGSSVRWDEDCLENGKELRRRERKERDARARESGEGELEKKGKGKERESRRSSDGRRRTPLSEVFPAGGAGSPEPESSALPILTVEAATLDGHSAPDDYSILEDEVQEQGQPLATPVKRARPRPLSEQLLGRSRPKAMHEGDDGVLSILDAATNDLAQLINHLDLEATPGTPDMTPLKPSPALLPFSINKDGNLIDYEDDSPTKKKVPQKHLAVSESPGKKSPFSSPSISSLRPYAQSRKNAVPATQKPLEQVIGQQITPWPTLIQNLSPIKASPKANISPVSSTNKTPTPTLRLTHKRTMTPAPDPEPAPVFMPLRPAKSKNVIATLKASSNLTTLPADSFAPGVGDTIRAPPSRTLGTAPSSHAGSKSAADNMRGSACGSPVPSPVFKRVKGRERPRASLVPVDVNSSSSQDSHGSKSGDDNNTVPIPPEARRLLGMSGTLGGSDVSAYASPELDASDPDSDIPDELQLILSHQSDDGDTMSFHEEPQLSSHPGSPPELPLPSGPPDLNLPTFRAHLIDDADNHADLSGNSSEEDTKKSFDFTGEIQKLNESGASDRHSFVEQLENAFRTPAKVDLRYGFSALLDVDIPPVPKLPAVQPAGDSSQESSSFDSYSVSEIADMKEPTLLHLNMTSTQGSTETEESKSRFELFSGSNIIDVKEPTLLPGSDSLANSSGTEDIVITDDDSLEKSLRTSSSSGSRPSDGQLNTSFKFGGRPKVLQTSASLQLETKPMTLSDIIPPLSHARSLSNSSIMEDDSVLNSIFAKASEIPQSRPRVNSDSSTKRRARGYRHSRHSSGLSFAGFDSFEEVRRGFEFGNDRVPFYPPAADRRNIHRRHDSVFSIASVSSYGRTIDYGLSDPFDYGLPSLRERPSSEDMSMSISVDDTFSFLGRQPRRRVESDASSFYFKMPPTTYTRGHRRHESNISVSSQAPPVSLYNRSFGAHRRNDSSSSAQSVALSYAMHGASGGRAAWARHRQDSSMDSVMSDFSAMRLGRPGIGDKMFDTAMDYGVPLTAISASPPESNQHFGNRSSFDYDSIIDDGRSSIDDSLFDKTGHPSSVSSDSVFGCDDAQAPQGRLLPPVQYRPLSVLSMNSVHSPMKEDDTMISMLGGGHVRRRSVHSLIDASPCVRIEKRKHSVFQDLKGLNQLNGSRESPNKARIVEKPSIASTSSFSFGGERMIKAQRGLLERQSLEDSCLIAEGEELTNSFHIPVFSRPAPVTRSRSSTCTSSSGGDTPPLSSSDGFSSMDEGSISSIDLSQINVALANATHPMSTIARNRIRTRARGHGHRRRASRAWASRSSVYETIEEEMSNSPSPNRSLASKKSSPTACQPIFIVEPDTASLEASPEQSLWDDENGIVALRKYYALKDEAHSTVTESKRQWIDTPFSIFAVQSFEPPRHPAGMQALLEHSVQNYGPLTSELRPRRVRSRTQSRPSPYPQSRFSKATSPSPAKVQPAAVKSKPSFGTPVLRQVAMNHNVPSAAPALDALKPFSPLVVDIEPHRENAFGLAPSARPRVGSAARRTALGWSKRSTGKSSTDLKENTGRGVITTPGESLRINRPRPRGRQTPASTARPIRV